MGTFDNKLTKRDKVGVATGLTILATTIGAAFYNVEVSEAQNEKLDDHLKHRLSAIKNPEALEQTYQEIKNTDGKTLAMAFIVSAENDEKKGFCVDYTSFQSRYAEDQTFSSDRDGHERSVRTICLDPPEAQ